MKSKLVLATVGPLVVLALQSQLHAADDGGKLVGTWEGNAGGGGFKEIWTITKNDKGEFAVSGVFKKGDSEAGSFTAKDCKFADGKLTFTQQYTKKPDPKWQDGSQMTASASGDTLTFEWKNSSGKGTVKLERQKTGAELAGTWQGTTGDGQFKESWTITRNDKGEFTVMGTYKKDDKDAGSFHGADCKYSSGALTCTQVYDKKPDPSWQDKTKLVIKASGDKLTYDWSNGGGSGSVSMDRAKK